MKLVYICSPYAGDVEKNIRFAGAACRYAAEHGCAPVAVHLLYPQILNDSVPSQREAGIRMGLRVLASCEELWSCGERVSHGMSREIAEAKRLGIPIRSISTEQIQGGIHMKQYGIRAHRSAASVCGPAEADRLMKNLSAPNVSCYPKERETEPEEAPAPGTKLQL